MARSRVQLVELIEHLQLLSLDVERMHVEVPHDDISEISEVFQQLRLREVEMDLEVEMEQMEVDVDVEVEKMDVDVYVMDEIRQMFKEMIRQMFKEMITAESHK